MCTDASYSQRANLGPTSIAWYEKTKSVANINIDTYLPLVNDRGKSVCTVLFINLYRFGLDNSF